MPTHRAGVTVLAAASLSVIAGCTRTVLRPPDCDPEPPPADTARVSGAPGAPFSVAGMVRTARERTAVPTASLDLEPLARVTVGTADGTFRFDSVPAGTYRLRVRRIGYRVRSVPVRVTDSAGVHVVVPLEVDVMDGCPGFMQVVERVPWWQFWK